MQERVKEQYLNLFALVRARKQLINNYENMEVIYIAHVEAKVSAMTNQETNDPFINFYDFTNQFQSIEDE